MGVTPWAPLVPALGRFHALALLWQRLGANCIPILAGEKKPCVAGWGDRGDGPAMHRPDSPKTSAEVLQGWAAQHFYANCAVLPGSADLTVVDVDDMERLDEVIAICGDTPYRTFSGRAGGGVHLWYRGATSSRNKICRGVDIKSSGGYVISPGSVHAKTGVEYSASPALLAALERGSW